MDKGVMYVAYGRKAYNEAVASIETLRKFHDWPVLVVGDKPIKGAKHSNWKDRGTPGRWAKVNLNRVTNWEYTLFLDADTRIHGDLSGATPLFELWSKEWERWKDKDQGAFLRALYKHPVNLAVLGWPFNSQNGDVV